MGWVVEIGSKDNSDIDAPVREVWTVSTDSREPSVDSRSQTWVWVYSTVRSRCSSPSSSLSWTWHVRRWSEQVPSTWLGYVRTAVQSATTDFQIQIHDYCTCSQKAKNQKAKQTIVHCTTTKQYKTRQESEMKCNAVKKN